MENIQNLTSPKNINSVRENMVVAWFIWHFIQMPQFLFSVWKNYIWFGLDFFSAPLLLVTLFSPWRKYRWAYPRGFDFVEDLNTFVSNSFSRIIGVICRIFLIIVSLPVLAFILLVGFVVILFWILLPFIVIILLYVGI